MADPNPFNAPIPGQSLTDTPGNHPWEKPPQFTTVDDAMNYIMNQFTDKDNIHNTLACLEMGIPVTTVVKTYLQQGFSNGKWTPDLIIALLKPLSTFIIYIATAAKIKFVPDYPKDNSQDAIYQLAKMRANKKANVTDTEVKAATEAVKLKAPAGLMAKQVN